MRIVTRDTDALTLLERALEQTAAIIAAIPAEQGEDQVGALGQQPDHGPGQDGDPVEQRRGQQRQYPAGPGGETAVEFAINPALFRDAFAADLPAETTALMAATERPIAAAAFSDASGPAAWRKLPCWAVVATGDKAAGADLIRSMARRAGADIVEVEGSHVIMISQPQAVTDHIVKAAQAVAAARQ
jgi:Alpha/beta hydrolase family